MGQALGPSSLGKEKLGQGGRQWVPAFMAPAWACRKLGKLSQALGSLLHYPAQEGGVHRGCCGQTLPAWVPWATAPAAFGSHNTPQFHAHTAPTHQLLAHSAGGGSSVTPLTTSACPPFFEVALAKGTPVLSQRTQGVPPSLPALSSLHPFSAWPPNTSPCHQPDLTMS